MRLKYCDYVPGKSNRDLIITRDVYSKYTLHEFINISTAFTNFHPKKKTKIVSKMTTGQLCARP